MNMAICRKFVLETLLNRDKQGLRGSNVGKGDIWVGYLLNIRQKWQTMTDSKKPSVAQHTADDSPTKREVEAKTKTGALDQSEAKRISAERSGQPHPDATRFGDWEKNGRCIDF